jgi:hypothetical protein
MGIPKHHLQYSRLYTEHQGLGNMDYVINSKNTLSGRYFYGTDPTKNSFNCGNTTPGPAGICLPGTEPQSVLESLPQS